MASTRGQGVVRREIRFELAWLKSTLLSWEMWLLMLLTAGLVTLGYQVTRPYSIDVGGGYDTPYVINFHNNAGDQTLSYRWTDEYSYILAPGIGGNVPYRMQVRIAGERPEGIVSPNIELLVNGQSVEKAALNPGWQTFTFDVLGPASSSRDLLLEIRSDTYRPEDQPGLRLGVAVDYVRLTPLGNGFVFPAVAQILYAMLSVAGIYALARRALFELTKRKWIPRAIAVLAAVSTMAAIAYVLAFFRLDYTPYARNLVIVLLIGLGLVLAGERLLRYLFRISGLPVGEREVRLLVAVALGAFLVKYGGLAYPHMIMIDLPHHMKFLRMVLRGQFAEVYLPGAMSAVPKGWGMDAIIPKSPLFYFIAAPLALIPGSIENTIKLFAALTDISVSFIIYYLVKRFVGTQRAALLSAIIYLFTPLTYRMLSYGILPTIFAQWLTALTVAVILIKYRRLNRPLVMLVVVLLLAATMVAFPTIMVFNTITLVIWGLLLIWMSADTEERRRVRSLAFSVAGALVVAFLSYYVLYVEPVLAFTIPAVTGRLESGGQVVGTGGLVETAQWTMAFYGTGLPFVAGLAGLATFAKKRGNRFWLLLAAWLVIPVVFAFVGMRFDMIGKHVLYAMLPLSICMGVLLDRFMGKGKFGLLFSYIIIAAMISWSISFWIFRIMYAGH